VYSQLKQCQTILYADFSSSEKVNLKRGFTSWDETSLQFNMEHEAQPFGKDIFSLLKVDHYFNNDQTPHSLKFDENYLSMEELRLTTWDVFLPCS